jgi:hypothetical protein
MVAPVRHADRAALWKGIRSLKDAAQHIMALPRAEQAKAH